MKKTLLTVSVIICFVIVSVIINRKINLDLNSKDALLQKISCNVSIETDKTNVDFISSASKTWLQRKKEAEDLFSESYRQKILFSLKRNSCLLKKYGIVECDIKDTTALINRWTEKELIRKNKWDDIVGHEMLITDANVSQTCLVEFSFDPTLNINALHINHVEYDPNDKKVHFKDSEDTDMFAITVLY